MAYEAIITLVGQAKIAAAIANGTPISIASMEIGDGNGNPTTPANTDTDLVRSVFSGAPNRVSIDTLDARRVVCELIVPVSEGGWTMRELGIFDGDGDLIAISRFPESYKPTAAEGATKDVVARMFIVVSDTSSISLIVDDSVTVATRIWVTEQLALLIPGGDTDQILTKVSNADGDYEWRDPTDVNVIVETREEEQTLSTSQTTVTLAVCTTDNLAVYVEGVRLHPPDWTATDDTTVTLASAYAAGSKIYFVQNDPGGAATYLRAPQNLADVPDKAEARTNLELLTSAPYLDALWKLMKQRDYPVGEIIETRRTGNPASWLGFGTWEAYAQGRVKVGHDPADNSFNALDLLGGAKTHVLTEAEMPSHRHRYGVEILGETIPVDNRVAVTGSNESSGSQNNGPFARSIKTTATGSNQAHNNMQPYIVVFMWKRTA